MSDNLNTQSATPATLPPSTTLAAVVGSFAGASAAAAGVGVIAEVSGANGSRVMSVLGRVTSGVMAVPTGTLAAPTNFAVGTDYLVDGVWICNPTGAAKTVTVTNGADQSVVYQEDVPARGRLPIDLRGMPLTGLKWVASATGMFGIAWGRTAL